LDLLNMNPNQTCNPGGSLCFMEGDKFSCAPPSVQLTGRWEELDTDGDGIWTREEVEKAKLDLQCKYIVNPVEVFDVLVKTEGLAYQTESPSPLLLHLAS